MGDCTSKDGTSRSGAGTESGKHQHLPMLKKPCRMQYPWSDTDADLVHSQLWKSMATRNGAVRAAQAQFDAAECF
jgi:hypothetical protein